MSGSSRDLNAPFREMAAQTNGLHDVDVGLWVRHAVRVETFGCQVLLLPAPCWVEAADAASLLRRGWFGHHPGAVVAV